MSPVSLFPILPRSLLLPKESHPNSVFSYRGEVSMNREPDSLADPFSVGPASGLIDQGKAAN